MATKRRVLKELDDISRDTDSGMSAELIDPRDMMHLKGRFTGPPDTPYEGGIYEIDIKLPGTYPFAPPVMRFITRVWHPNISSMTGAICLDTLASKWSPVLTVKTALLSLQSLLATPEPNDPQDAIVAKQMMEEPEAFRATAREWAVKYAAAEAADETDEQAKQRELDGYSEEVVDRFTGMGFSRTDVVKAFRSANVERGCGITEQQAARVIDNLIGG